MWALLLHPLSLEVEGEVVFFFLTGEVERNANMAGSVDTCEQTGRSCRPRPCFSYYITIIHGNNTSHAVTAVI